MDIENKTMFLKDEFYQRYRFIIDWLIKKWVYKWLKYKKYDKE